MRAHILQDIASKSIPLRPAKCFGQRQVFLFSSFEARQLHWHSSMNYFFSVSDMDIEIEMLTRRSPFGSRFVRVRPPTMRKPSRKGPTQVADQREGADRSVLGNSASAISKMA